MRRDSVPEPGCADLLMPIPILFCVLRTPDAQARGSSVVTVDQHSMVMRPVRLKGISHTMPIGWLQRVSDARLPHVDSKSSGTASPVPKYISSGVCP